MEEDVGTILNTRIRYFCVCIVAIVSVMALRLVHLQIIQRHILFVRSQKNFQRFERVCYPRGTILDVNGVALATNRPAVDIYWHGSGRAPFTAEQRVILERLSAITGKNILDDPVMLGVIRHAERYGKDALLISDVDFEMLCQIEEQLPHTGTVRIVSTFKRHYPHKKIACHIVGYLANMDPDALGKMGLEKICQDELKGREGERLKTVNSFGTSLSEIELTRGLSGDDIYTTLDFNLQTIAESLLPEGQAGTVIVMDPTDGAIRALVSRPDFDPEFFLRHFSTHEWEELQNSQPFLNRAFNACYPPGSIFKIVTMSAGLEHKVVTPDALWNCQGFATYAGRSYACALHTGHGTLTTCESLTHSCNIAFYHIGKKLKIDALAECAKKFGLGSKTGVVFSENEGLIPTRSWKRSMKNERWWPGDTLAVAIGQSYLLVTPIQVACMIGSIFTRNLVTPRILAREPVVKRPLEIGNDVLGYIKKAMRDVVLYGTGRKVGKISGFDIYAKTSTAQVSALENRDRGTEHMEHAWFVAYFIYKNRNPLVLVILMEHAGSSRIATGVARDFLLAYRNLHEGRTAAYDTVLAAHKELERSSCPAPQLPTA